MYDHPEFVFMQVAARHALISDLAAERHQSSSTRPARHARALWQMLRRCFSARQATIAQPSIDSARPA